MNQRLVTILNETTQRAQVYAKDLLPEKKPPEVKAYIINEPRHDKTTKMSVRPAKTPISLGIRPVWSESSLRMPRLIGVFAVRSMGS